MTRMTPSEAFVETLVAQAMQMIYYDPFEYLSTARSAWRCSSAVLQPWGSMLLGRFADRDLQLD